MDEKRANRGVELPQQTDDPYAGVSDDLRSSYERFDAKHVSFHRQERNLLRQIDWRLLPPFAHLYFMTFLDKNNEAQAKLAGLEKDLGLVGMDCNTATSIYFVG